MAKWISPREQLERDTAKLVAQYRPAAKVATEALTADWTVIPGDAENQIRHALMTALAEAGLPATGDVNRAAFITLQDECYKPFAARRLAEKRAAEKAAEAAVDVNRPIVAQCVDAHRIGELVIYHDSQTRTDRVLVCIGVGRGYDNELGDTEWYSDLAEPNEAEQASADYQRMSATATTENAREAAKSAEIHNRHEAARNASLADGHEPTLLDDLFAGGSDD